VTRPMIADPTATQRPANSRLSGLIGSPPKRDPPESSGSENKVRRKMMNTMLTTMMKISSTKTGATSPSMMSMS
jgi:hypothetical protein